MRKSDIKLSKFLSLILRHAPETVGLRLDDGGWVAVDDLLHAAMMRGIAISRDRLDQIVYTNDKQRFAFSPDGLRIRANQGQSADIDLRLEPSKPPSVLFHGTASRFLGSIRAQGLRRMQRQYVHLSGTVEQAHCIGARYGRPVVLQIDSEGMTGTGHLFFLSANSVWLTTFVPVQFIEVLGPNCGQE